MIPSENPTIHPYGTKSHTHTCHLYEGTKCVLVKCVLDEEKILMGQIEEVGDKFKLSKGYLQTISFEI